MYCRRSIWCCVPLAAMHSGVACRAQRDSIRILIRPLLTASLLVVHLQIVS